MELQQGPPQMWHTALLVSVVNLLLPPEFFVFFILRDFLLVLFILLNEAGFGAEVADEPLDIDELKGNVAATFAKYESLVIGTPTWNTGADTERSGTAWDYELCKHFSFK
jgi:hypothetical protein